MAVHIKLAETETELDQIFRLRHQVFAIEKHYMPITPDGRLYDRFDTFPKVGNIIAVTGGCLVGGVRIVQAEAALTPAQEYFDFFPYLPLGARTQVGSVGMFVIEPSYRKGKLFLSLMGMCHYWALLRGLTHLIAPLSPDAEPCVQRLGYKPLTPRYFDESKQLYVCPMMLEMDRMADRLQTFVTRCHLDHCMHDFGRAFYQAGEVVFQAGDEGNAAYIIIAGAASVEVKSRVDGSSMEVARRHPGDLFGELALLTNRRRTATIRAITDLDLMVLAREAFRNQLARSPVIMETLLAVLGNRLAAMLEQLEQGEFR